MRNKEDSWNPILSGAATGGLLAARAGPKIAAKNAAIGGVILAGIEGLGVFSSRVIMPWVQDYMTKQEQGASMKIDLLEPPNDPLRAALSSVGVSTAGRTQYDSQPLLSAETGSSKAEGFDLGSINNFDTAGADWSEGMQSGSELGGGKSEKEPPKKGWLW
jgi:hypothetical protein